MNAFIFVKQYFKIIVELLQKKTLQTYAAYKIVVSEVISLVDIVSFYRDTGNL